MSQIITPLEFFKNPQLLDVADLPKFELGFTQGKQSDYCIIIPVINEGERILKQLQGMQAQQFGLDIILVDGGSTDGSTDITQLQVFGVNTLITKRDAGKLSAQMRLGFAWALEQGYRGMVLIDGNGKDGFDTIPSFIKKLKVGYDYVQGSRYIRGGVAVNTPTDRAMAVKLIHAPIISLAARQRFTDTTNGFRGFSSKFLLDARVRPLRAIFMTYNLHYYLTIRCPRLGFKACETAVTRSYPKDGPVPSKIGGFSCKVHIIKQLLLAAMGAYNPR